MTFRVPQWAVAELEGEELSWAVIEPMWSQLRTPYEPDPRLQQATAGQRALYALHWLWSEVSNGGFHQYLWNPTGRLFSEALQGAQKLAVRMSHQQIDNEQALLDRHEVRHEREGRAVQLLLELGELVVLGALGGAVVDPGPCDRAG